MQDRLDDVLEEIGLEERLDVEAVAMLRGEEHPLDLDGPLDAALVDVVADRHLRLPVRPEIRQHVRLSHLGHPLRELVREHDRHRHELVGLVRRVAEHHSLVSGADQIQRIRVAMLRLVRRVDALCDVGRLAVDRDHDAARLEVEPVLRTRIADLGDAFAHDRADVDVRVGRDLAGDDDEPGGDEGLARDAPVRVVREDRVEDGVRDLIRDLVGMTLGDRLRREGERARCHGPEGYLSPPTATRSWAHGS